MSASLRARRGAARPPVVRRDGRAAVRCLFLALLLGSLCAGCTPRGGPPPAENSGVGRASEGMTASLGLGAALPGASLPGGSREGSTVSERDRPEDRLLEALEESVQNYATPLQLLGTAPYYSSEAALALVLSYDGAVTAAAEKAGVEKAMLQAVLFQEIRFLNLLDEVDLFVAATHAYLRQLEEYEELPREERVYALPPVRPVVYRLDSSTGLGQIFADTAIRAVNWQAGFPVYDRTDWHDLSAVWDRLRSDDVYNIETAALVLAYKRGVLQAEGNPAPTAADIMQAYNGTGELSRRYREAVCAYCEAFRRWNSGMPG